VSELGESWDRLVNAVTELRAPRVLPTLVIHPRRWSALLAAASPEVRADMETWKRAGRVMLTVHLPNPDMGYVLTVPE
jgi:hypothetical protein